MPTDVELSRSKVLLYPPILSEGIERIKNGDLPSGKDLGTVGYLRESIRMKQIVAIERTNMITRSKAKAIFSNFPVQRFL